ncbi:MAG: SIS domain-containing protein [Clostridia bacterium]|nr:SIS domain-containing protein [Clostridia bacterium]
MIKELIKRYPALDSCKAEIEAARDALIECYENGGKLLLAGNGGSSADCDHIVGELMKGFLLKRPIDESRKEQMQKSSPALDGATLDSLQMGLPAISLTSISALNTAFANDVDLELIYAQSVLALGKAGDVLIAISTSGNAKNVCEAAKVARAIGMKVIALTGRDGGKLKSLSDVCVIAPECETYKIQELHLPIYHYICAEVEKHFFG